MSQPVPFTTKDMITVPYGFFFRNIDAAILALYSFFGCCFLSVSFNRSPVLPAQTVPLKFPEEGQADSDQNTQKDQSD